MADRFSDVADTPAMPPRGCVVVVPDDARSLATVAKALYVGTGGSIVMRGIDDATDQLWKNIPSGALIPFRVAAIRATGTTAADMLALY